jgi:hypothetical protein
MKSRKIVLAIFGTLMIIAINMSISNQSKLSANFSLKSLINTAMAACEGSSTGCSSCGSGKGTCTITCDGVSTTCSNVKGIEVSD